jgi:hypothetical protein
VGSGRNDNSTRLGYSFKPGGNIYTVAKEIVAFYDDIADIDPDPKFKTLILRHGDVAFRDIKLNLQCATRGVNDTREFDQKSIAGGLDDTAPMRGNLGIKGFPPMSLERGKRTFLVGTHQAAVARNVSSEDGSQPSFDARLGHKDRPANVDLSKVYAREYRLSIGLAMSVLGQKRKSQPCREMSALPPLAVMADQRLHIC